MSWMHTVSAHAIGLELTGLQSQGSPGQRAKISRVDRLFAWLHHSDGSLCYHCPTISDRWRYVSAFRRAHDPRRHALGLASPSHRHRRRVSAGMAVWEASRVLAVEKSPCSLLLASIPTRTSGGAPSRGLCQGAGICYEEKCLESGDRGRIYHLPLLFQSLDGRI